ncbi:MAG: hypothetical protein WD898_00075 [Candidatus Paceibacterota bacterium]
MIRLVKLIALFMSLGFAASGQTASPFFDPCKLPPKTAVEMKPLPERWNGITYYSRAHHFYDMINDWWTVDKATGRYVYELADEDLKMLSEQGVNFIHHYIWDNVWFTENGWHGVGFDPVGKNPCASDNRQWAALDDFLSRAEKYGLFVGIHFAAKPPIDALQTGKVTPVQAKDIADEYVEWVGTFIRRLSPRHNNIAMWGFIFAVGPAPGVGDEKNGWNAFIKHGFGPLQKMAREFAPKEGLGLMAINFPFLSGTEDGFRYRWDTKYVQRALRVMNNMDLDPDIYMLQCYNADTNGLAKAIAEVTGPPLTDDADSLDPNKVLVVEVGSSTSVAPPPYGVGVAGKGDADSPSHTLEGQAQWLTNTLCALKSGGIKKIAFWTLYDAHDFWEKEPFNSNLLENPWGGFWGLVAYDPKDLKPRNKPALRTLSDFYLLNRLACSSPPRPVLSLTADKYSGFSGSRLKITWTAADVAGLEIDNGVGPVKGTLGSVTLQFPRKVGWYTYTLTGKNSSEKGEAIEKASIKIRTVPLPHRSRKPDNR